MPDAAPAAGPGGLQVAYGTLYRRIPNLRLPTTDIADLSFERDGFFRGARELAVTW